jgi:undecaprenyl phosphate-alpha-L-ara4N flippase subunit ArnE
MTDMSMNNLTLLILALLQSALLAMGQVLLKFGLVRTLPFGWNRAFWHSLAANLPLALSGLSFLAASLLWIFIIKHFPLSTAYPLVSLSYVFGMIAAIVFFHETVDLAKWLGVLLIMMGCFLILRN